MDELVEEKKMGERQRERERERGREGECVDCELLRVFPLWDIGCCRCRCKHTRLLENTRTISKHFMLSLTIVHASSRVSSQTKEITEQGTSKNIVKHSKKENTTISPYHQTGITAPISSRPTENMPSAVLKRRQRLPVSCLVLTVVNLHFTVALPVIE